MEAINSEAGQGHGPGIELIEHSAGATAGADEAHARDAVAALLDQGVHALIGPGAPWLSDVVAPFAQAACTPMVTPAPGKSFPYVFAAGPTQAQTTNAMLRAVARRKVGILALDRLSTPDSADAQRLGVTLTGIERFPLTATDLSGPASVVSVGVRG